MWVYLLGLLHTVDGNRFIYGLQVPMALKPDSRLNSTPVLPGLTNDDLFGSEQWWKDQYEDICDSGFQLRPRYHPNWVPSWKASGKFFLDVEDGQPTIVSDPFLHYQR